MNYPFHCIGSKAFPQKSILFNIYCILVAGILPMIVTPWRSEAYYDGKIIFLAVITLLFCMLYYGPGTRRWNRISIFEGLIYTMFALALISTVLSSYAKLSILGTPTCREGLIVLVLNFVVFWICYHEFTFSARVMEIILALSSMIGIYAMLNYFRVLPVIQNALGVNISTFGNTDFGGTYCTLLIPLALGYYLRTGNKRIIPCLGILFCTLVVCMTRSSWIAIAISITLFAAFIIVLHKQKIYTQKVLVLLLALVMTLAVLLGAMQILGKHDLGSKVKNFAQDVKQVTSDKAGSGRMLFWKRISTFMFDYPLIGSGPDTLGQLYKNKYGKDITMYPKAHNEYLQMAVSVGYPYLLVYLCLVGMVMYRLVRVICRTGNILLIAIFCAILGYLVQAFFNISVITSSPIYWGLLGIGTKFGSIHPGSQKA